MMVRTSRYALALIIGTLYLYVALRLVGVL